MMECGAQSVTNGITGITRKQLSCVCNLDFKEQVYYSTCSYTILYYRLLIIIIGISDATALRNSHFGDGTGPYHLSEVDCSGEERTLLECSHYTIGYHICQAGRDVGVRCDGIANKL